MGRHLITALSAATIVAALSLSGCSSDERGASTGSEPAPTSASAPSTAAGQVAPLPPPDDLAKVLYRLADPAVPGNQKLNLVEGAAPDNAGAFDQFATALLNGGFAPMKVDVRDVAWSDRDPANVAANVSISSPNPKGPKFSFPMEFTPVQGGWQLSARTADVLLAYSPGQPRRRRRRPVADPTMWIGWLEFDLLLGDVHSLKQKRSVIRPVVAELQRKFSVSAAETGSHELYRRAGIGLAMASADRGHAVEVLDAAERLVAAHPEFELLSVRRGLSRSDD